MEGQGKEEGSESAEEVCCTAVHVDNSNTVFLLMAEATVSNRDCILVVVGNEDDNNHPGIVVAATTSRTMMTTMSLLRSWQQPNNKNNVAAPVVNSGNFWIGLSPL